MVCSTSDWVSARGVLGLIGERMAYEFGMHLVRRVELGLKWQ